MENNTKKNSDKLKEIYSYLEKKYKEKNIEQMEVYMSSVNEEDIKVREKTLDTFVLSETSGFALRLLESGRVGSSYTENIDKESLDILFDNAYNSIKYYPSEVNYNKFTESDTIKEKNYEVIDEKLKNIDIQKLKEVSLEIEDTLYNLDSKVINVPYAGLSRYTTTKGVINNFGICKTETKLAIVYAGDIMAKNGENVKTASNSYRSKNSDFDIKSFCESIVEEAVDKLNAKKLTSGNYKTVFSSDGAATIFSAYLSMFSSESVQKKLSLLKDKKNKKVASECLTIIDNPFRVGGLGSTNFDSEGVSTKETVLIENGILKNYLYNNYTSKKDKCISSGHASRGSYKSPIGISIHNFIVSNGEIKQEDLINDIKDGILVTDLMGLHAGVNVLSGDFSLQAEGKKIENGKVVYTLSPFIVSGNILNLFKNILSLSNDTKENRSSIYSPSILIKELSFAG